MKKESSESARVYRARGGGCSTILGIPFIGMGLLSLGIGVIVLLRDRESVSLAIAGAAFLVGLLILSISVPAVSTTEGVTLDRFQGTATEWRRIFGRFKALGTYPLNEFRSVEIYSRKKPGSHYYVYYVRLTGGPKELVICAQTLIERARETARDASEFLSVPLEDKIGSDNPDSVS